MRFAPAILAIIFATQITYSEAASAMTKATAKTKANAYLKVIAGLKSWS